MSDRRTSPDQAPPRAVAAFVLRAMESLARLTDAEQAALNERLGRVEAVDAGGELLREGEATGRARVIVSGWACRQRVLPDGRRQVFGFLLPGDVIGFGRRTMAAAPCDLVAVTRLECCDLSQLRELLSDPKRDLPGLRAATAASIEREERLLLDQVVRLGRQSAHERVAHLLLELHGRLRKVGLADDRRFPLPLTQEILADALGLSIVHVNRTLQQLRREEMIELRGGAAVLRDRELLAITADYRDFNEL